MPGDPQGRPLQRVVRCAAIGAPLVLAGCAGGVMDPAGPVGAGDAQILLDAVLVMLAIVIPTLGLALWAAWRYRASNTKARYLPTWSFDGRIEAVVWSIPILTIMFLAGLIWIGSTNLDPFKPLPSKEPPLEVQVVALDWKWLFIYPQQNVAAVNQLVIPAGRPVHFQITSASVFDGFFVPRLGSMIYAMPGMVSQLNLQADRPGEFMGESSQFSGDGFSDMQFQVKSVAPADFDAWTHAAVGSGQMLDAPAYQTLAKPSQAVAPYTYRGVAPGLFQDIASQKTGPAPGPAAQGAHAGREVSKSGDH